MKKPNRKKLSELNAAMLDATIERSRRQKQNYVKLGVAVTSFLVLLLLKLTVLYTWSWWVITLPLYAAILLIIVLYILYWIFLILQRAVQLLTLLRQKAHLKHKQLKPN